MHEKVSRSPTAQGTGSKIPGINIQRRRHETSGAHWAAEAMAITGDKALLLLGQEDAAAATVAVGAPNIATWEEGRAAAAAMRDMDAAFNLSAML